MSFDDSGVFLLEKLKKPKDFLKVYRQGRLLKGNFFWLYAMETELGKIRFGVAISKKIVKKAAVRNRIKRITQEYIKQNYEAKDIGADFILNLKCFREPNPNGSKELREDIRSLLGKWLDRVTT
ncbi:MAG: ribonuclease P protein component [Candidatus Omnitrophota bacterium]